VLLALGITRALREFAGWSDTLGPLSNFTITGPVVAQGLLLSLLVGLLAGIASARGAARKAVVESLHEVF